MHIVVIGLGYSGTALAAQAAGEGLTVSITSRKPGVAGPPGVSLVPFAAAGPRHRHRHPPGGDRRAGRSGRPYAARARSCRNRRRAGACAGSATCPPPASTATGAAAGWTRRRPRRRRPIVGRRRVAAEQAWVEAGRGRAVDLFRLAGIYGPGRSVLDDVRAGRARRVDKPGHAFGRIHRDDIVGARARRHGAGPAAGRPRAERRRRRAGRQCRMSSRRPARLLGLRRCLRWCPTPMALAAMHPMARSASGRTTARSAAMLEPGEAARGAAGSHLARRWLHPTYPRPSARGLLGITASIHRSCAGPLMPAPATAALLTS